MLAGRHYIALPAEESTEHALESRTLCKPGNYRTDRLILWAAIGVACSTALSVMLFVFTILHPHNVAARAQITISIPHRPNPYHNLDNILANTTHWNFPPVTNFPPVAFQFDKADPSRHMHEEDRGRSTFFGRVFPDDRRIAVTDQISTVVQFRHLDYGMERCVLKFRLPQPNELFDPAVKLADPSIVDVWLLDAPTELSRYISGSMDYGPKRQELLTTLTFSHSGPSQSHEFHCASGEFSTLELACSPTNSECSVDFWQDQRAKPMGGLHLVQYASPPPKVIAG